MALAPATGGRVAPPGVRVECGEAALSEWGNFRARALGILRKSNNQWKCLDLMRLKARDLLGLQSVGEKDYLSLKEGGDGSAWPAISPPKFEEQDVRQEGSVEEDLIDVPRIEIEVIGNDEFRLGAVDSLPWTAAGGSIVTVGETSTMVVEVIGFRVKEAVYTNSVLVCDGKNPVRTPLGDDMLSFGKLLLRVDDEPPDPGIALSQTQDYKTVQVVKFQAVGASLLVYQFFCPGDWKNVMEGGPWNIRYHPEAYRPMAPISKRDKKGLRKDGSVAANVAAKGSAGSGLERRREQ